MNRKISIIAAFSILSASLFLILGCTPNNERVHYNVEGSLLTETTIMRKRNGENKEMNIVSSIEESNNEEMVKKQVEINSIKKLVEDDAEKDRHNILEALGNKESDEHWSTAISFIKDNYPDYFSTDELINSSIKYGYYLETVYKDFVGLDNDAGRYYEMGNIVSEVAVAACIGTNSTSHQSTNKKLERLEELLQINYTQYYGKKAMSRQVTEYILHGQDDIPEASQLKWSEIFLDQVDIEQLYESYLYEYESRDNINDFAAYLTNNAPVSDNWKELFADDLLQAYEQIPIRYEQLDDYNYQVYVKIDNIEVPYVVINSRTGYFHG